MERPILTFFTSLGCCILLCTGCQPTGSQEYNEAASLLTSARQLLSAGNYSDARDSILALRRDYPTAIQVRRAAILTLDSVELLETRDSLERYEARLEAERAAFAKMQPRVNGATNDAYYTQQRLIHDMEFHFDELCAKVKFYARKIDIDIQQTQQ